MPNVINLRQARKDAARKAARAAGDAAAAQHGLSRAERAQIEDAAERLARILDGARREASSDD